MNLMEQYVYSHDQYLKDREEMVEAGGRIVRSLRHDAGYSLRKFAKMLGVSVGFLSKIENGHYTLPAELARKMIEVVNGSKI